MADKGLTVEVDGVLTTSKKLSQIGARSAFKAVRVIATSALNIQLEAKQLLTSQKAVDTGRLRSSIQIEPNGLSFRKEIGTPVVYGPFIEFGTSKMAARPFLRPAYNREKPRFLRELASAIRESAR